MQELYPCTKTGLYAQSELYINTVNSERSDKKKAFPSVSAVLVYATAISVNISRMNV